MAYIRCVLDAKENKRVIVQNGQREATCSIERHLPLVSRVSVAECVVASSCAVFSPSVGRLSIRACLCFRER